MITSSSQARQDDHTSFQHHPRHDLVDRGYSPPGSGQPDRQSPIHQNQPPWPENLTASAQVVQLPTELIVTLAVPPEVIDAQVIPPTTIFPLVNINGI